MYESYLNCPRGWESLLILQRNCSHLKRILPDFIMVLLEYFPLTGEGLNFFSILAIEWIINKNIRMCQMHFDSVFPFGILDKYHKLSIYKLISLLWNNIHEVPHIWNYVRWYCLMHYRPWNFVGAVFGASGGVNYGRFWKLSPYMIGYFLLEGIPVFIRYSSTLKQS